MWRDSARAEFHEDGKTAFASYDLDNAHDVVEQTAVCWIGEVVRFVYIVGKIGIHGKIDYAVLQGCWKVQQSTAAYDDGLRTVSPCLAAVDGSQVPRSVTHWFGTCF